MAKDKHDSSLKVVMVHKDEVMNLWPEIKHHFERVVNRNKETITMDAFYDRCLRGDTGAKILLIPQLSGYDMQIWLGDLVKQLYIIADNLGCFKVMICGARPGWAKVMKQHGGYVETVTVEFDIKANIAKYKD